MGMARRQCAPCDLGACVGGGPQGAPGEPGPQGPAGPGFAEYAATDLDEAFESDASPVLLLTLSPVVAGGTYRVGWRGETAAVGVAAALVSVRIDGAEVAIDSNPQLIGVGYRSVAGFAVLPLVAGPHDVEYYLWSSVALQVVTTRRVWLEVWRVG